MKNSKPVMGVVVLFALLAVVMAVVSVKMSPLDQNTAAFVVEDPYLRSDPAAPLNATAYLTLRNQTGRDDRLIGVRADVAGVIELQTPARDAGTVMRQIDGGIALADGAAHAFVQGGDHILVSGLQVPLAQGQLVPVTLMFEHAGDVEITVPVDHTR